MLTKLPWCRYMKNVSERSVDRANVVLFHFTTASKNSVKPLFHTLIRNNVVCLCVSRQKKAAFIRYAVTGRVYSK